MKHENGTCEIITQKGIDMIATVEPAGWVTVAYHGSNGLIVDYSEWEAFVKLVKKIDAHVVDKG